MYSVVHENSIAEELVNKLKVLEIIIAWSWGKTNWLSIAVVISQTFSFLEIHCIILAILVLNLTIILSITTFVVNRHTDKLEATRRKYNSILKTKIRKIIVSFFLPHVLNISFSQHAENLRKTVLKMRTVCAPAFLPHYFLPKDI